MNLTVLSAQRTENCEPGTANRLLQHPHTSLERLKHIANSWSINTRMNPDPKRALHDFIGIF